MPTSPGALLFVGTHGNVRAVDKATGADVWTTSLPRSGYGIVTLIVEDGVVFAASGGRLFALDAATGELRWTNKLRRLGSGNAVLATARTAGGAGEVLDTEEGEDPASGAGG